MPCPFFEPQEIARTTGNSGGRTPLIDEYTGSCHLRQERLSGMSPELRLLGCNSGNVQHVCADLDRFRGGERAGSVARFTVQNRLDDRLKVTVVEEQGGRPINWHTVTYSPAAVTIDPAIDDPCRRAQVLAFCRSYLLRFPLQTPFIPHAS